jgi:DNA-binding transcriptional LysR family regulator
MELRHLRAFVTVAETGTFSRAALQLHITQPALWRQVRSLERELGVRLFERRGRRVRLSIDGEALARRGRDLLAAAELLGEHARALREGQRGTLRVGASPMTLQSVVAPFLAAFLTSHPGIDIQVSEGGSLELPAMVERGELHLAVGMLRGDEPLGSRTLFPWRVLAATATGDRRPRSAPVPITAFHQQSLLMLRPGFATRELFDSACRTAGVRPRILFEAGDTQSLLALAEVGRGIAIVPSTTVFGQHALAVAPVMSAGASLGHWVSVIWDPRRFMPEYGTRFVEELARWLRRRYPGREFERRAPPIPRPLW